MLVKQKSVFLQWPDHKVLQQQASVVATKISWIIIAKYITVAQVAQLVTVCLFL